MIGESAGLAVRKTITVDVPAQRAFTVFAERMGSWWPLADKSIGAAPAETVVLEPFPGGRWFERGVDGSECAWGRVLAFEPPTRLLLAWQIGADWKHDPALHTEVEVRFVAEDESRTRIELEHRGLEAFGADAASMQTLFDSPNAWESVLDAYAAAAAASSGG